MASRMVGESLQIGAYAELEGRYWMFCVNQGGRVGAIRGSRKCRHVSLGRTGLEVHPRELLWFLFLLHMPALGFLEFCSVVLEPDLRRKEEQWVGESKGDSTCFHFTRYHGQC